MPGISEPGISEPGNAAPGIAAKILRIGLFFLGATAGTTVLVYPSQVHASQVHLSMLAGFVQAAPAAPAKASSFLGTVASIDGKQLTVKNDAGATMQVAVQDDARTVRIEPGQTSLAGATPFSLTDLQVGDRVLVRGAPGPDGKSLSAAVLVAIKKADIAQKQAKEQEDWQRGVGGLVKSVDPSAGTITVSTGVAGGNQSITVQTSKSTIVRRYAPGSVKFDDAKPSTLAEIHPGDQLRARGTKSDDGHAITADEIVSGSFRNIAGTITSINPGSSTITLTDLATKKPVVIEITPESSLKKLDPAVAQRMAMRLHGGGGGAGERGAGEHGAGSVEPGSGAPPSGRPAPNPQQILSRAPTMTLNELQPGNVVMLVAMEGRSPGSVAAVTLVSGVEPMLQASASESQAMLSSSWNMGGGGAAGGGDAP